MTTAEIQITGTCDPRFAAVREAFAENFASNGEVGAAVAVVVDNKPVVDLWGGYSDPERSHNWEQDTIANVFSTTKGMTAICAHRLVEEGKLDPDARVSTYWPEFAQAGKDSVPVRMLLNHQVGLPGVTPRLTVENLYDWDFMTAALAAETPWWTPGTAHGYHAITYGWLAGELVRRVTGMSLGTYFRTTFAEPLRLDFHIGTPRNLHGRIADMIQSLEPIAIQTADPASIRARVLGNPGVLDAVNTDGWRTAELPAANGHGTARPLARIYGALAAGGDIDGIHVLSPSTVEQATREESNGYDQVLEVTTRFGLGFMLNGDFVKLGPNPQAFGHPGAGGSLGFADTNAGLGFGYVMNQMRSNLSDDPRVRGLIDALYSCV